MLRDGIAPPDSNTSDLGRVDRGAPADAGTESMDTMAKDASIPTGWTCEARFYNAGRGCHCGCGVADPDCPSPSQASDCDVDFCDNPTQPDPTDPSQCVIVGNTPPTWTCDPKLYDDGKCNCGCGVIDDNNCGADVEIERCRFNYDGCEDGFGPDRQDPAQCVPVPKGWTCSWFRMANNRCDCGCGIADPECPADARVSDCKDDGCKSGGPDPKQLTACISNPPQDRWTCADALLFDGASCDCGCGATDPDCPADATEASCDTVNCGKNKELISGQIGKCQETCAPRPGVSGSARCTNGGSFSVGSACSRHLSRCTDGNRYAMECSGGECICRVNGGCAARFAGSGCSFRDCGWSLIDAT